MKNTYQNRARRKLRTRMKIKKTNPLALRLSIFRSNKHTYAQIIDVKAGGKILLAVSDQQLKEKTAKKTDKSALLGEMMAEKALKKNLKRVVFDKGSCSFKGRIKAFAEGSRKGGLKF